jgi:hypothetical protein
MRMFVYWRGLLLTLELPTIAERSVAELSHRDSCPIDTMISTGGGDI